MAPPGGSELVTLRDIRAGDLDRLAAIVQSPGVREWFGPADTGEYLREGLWNDGAAFVIQVDREPAGWLAYTEELDPDYRHASLDIALVPGHQGHGHGPQALRLAIRRLAARSGHHRFTIDPAAHNTRAIRAYTKIGFRPVGTLRQYERGHDGTFHDGLLMDLLLEELT